MHARLPLSIFLLVVLTTFAVAFAPAPVFKEPPKPKVPEIVSAIQGTWDYQNNARFAARGGLMRTIRVRIQGNTWTYIYITNGVEREGAKYEIVLDAKQNPPTLDLKNAVGVNQPARPGGLVAQFALKGIVKVEGGTLTYRYVSGYNQHTIRPKQFDANQMMPNGDGASTMTLQRVK